MHPPTSPMSEFSVRHIGELDSVRLDFPPHEDDNKSAQSSRSTKTWSELTPALLRTRNESHSPGGTTFSVRGAADFREQMGAPSSVFRTLSEPMSADTKMLQPLERSKSDLSIKPRSKTHTPPICRKERSRKYLFQPQESDAPSADVEIVPTEEGDSAAATSTEILRALTECPEFDGAAVPATPSKRIPTRIKNSVSFPGLTTFSIRENGRPKFDTVKLDSVKLEANLEVEKTPCKVLSDAEDNGAGLQCLREDCTPSDSTPADPTPWHVEATARLLHRSNSEPIKPRAAEPVKPSQPLSDPTPALSHKVPEQPKSPVLEQPQSEPRPDLDDLISWDFNGKLASSDSSEHTLTRKLSGLVPGKNSLLRACFPRGNDNETDENAKIVSYKNGTTYKGSLSKEGRREGRGIMSCANGNLIYAGMWHNGEMHGEGKAIYKDGHVYIGEFVDGHRHGRGVMTLAWGETYDGEWKMGLQDGYGTFGFTQNDTKGDVYEGEWKGGKFHGKGKMTYNNGNVFEGEYQNGMRNGSGLARFANGEVYEGEYKDNLFSGQGTMKYADGGLYVGEFRKNLCHGEGAMTFKDGSSYRGGYEHGFMSGFGKFRYANGDKYKGHWQNDTRFGWGALKFANGDVFKGRFFMGGMMQNTGVLEKAADRAARKAQEKAERKKERKEQKKAERKAEKEKDAAERLAREAQAVGIPAVHVQEKESVRSSVEAGKIKADKRISKEHTHEHKKKSSKPKAEKEAPTGPSANTSVEVSPENVLLNESLQSGKKKKKAEKDRGEKEAAMGEEAGTTRSGGALEASTDIPEAVQDMPAVVQTNESTVHSQDKKKKSKRSKETTGEASTAAPDLGQQASESIQPDKKKKSSKSKPKSDHRETEASAAARDSGQKSESNQVTLARNHKKTKKHGMETDTTERPPCTASTRTDGDEAAGKRRVPLAALYLRESLLNNSGPSSPFTPMVIVV